MNGEAVVKHSIASVILGALMGFSTPSFADNAYYLELGNDTTRGEAQNQWDGLVRKHKSMLGKLTFFPKDVIQSGNKEATRIQAGSIDTKDKADKICSALFKANVACFVIAGLNDAPPKSTMNWSEQSTQRPVKIVQLPWLVGEHVTSPYLNEPTSTPNDQMLSDSDSNSSNRQAEGACSRSYTGSFHRRPGGANARCGQRKTPAATQNRPSQHRCQLCGSKQ